MMQMEYYDINFIPNLMCPVRKIADMNQRILSMQIQQT